MATREIERFSYHSHLQTNSECESEILTYAAYRMCSFEEEGDHHIYTRPACLDSDHTGETFFIS